MVWCGVIAYMSSVAFAVYGLRLYLKCREWDWDGFAVFMCLAPVMNIIWGILAWCEAIAWIVSERRHANHHD